MEEGALSQELPAKTAENQRHSILDQTESDRLTTSQLTFDDVNTKSVEPSDLLPAIGSLSGLINSNRELLTKAVRGNTRDFYVAIRLLNSAFRYYYGCYPLLKDGSSFREDIVDFVNFGADLLRGHTDKLEETVNSSENSYISEEALQSADWLARIDAEFAGKFNSDGKAMDLLLRYFDKAAGWSKIKPQYRYWYPDVPVLRTIFEFGSSSQAEKGKSMVVDLLKHTDPLVRQAGIRMIAGCGMSPRKELINSYMGDIVSSVFGVDGRKMAEVWGDTTFKKSMSADEEKRRQFLFFRDNLEQLSQLEERRPGIGKVLQSEFGINDFSRYPLEFLIAQYDQKDSKVNLPNGVIVYPQSDWNGAYTGIDPKEMLERFFDQMKGKYRITVWETGNTLGLVKALNKTRQKYGRITLAVIGGHGEKDNIMFGRPEPATQFSDKRKVLQQEEIRRRGASAIKLAFADNSTVILESCSTGQLGGIGQEISEIAGVKIIAPAKDASIAGIKVNERKDGESDFNVFYFGENEELVATQVYKSGILQ